MAPGPHGIPPDERDIVITRDLAAPRDLVWRVWTSREHLPRWWGPEGFLARVEAYDFRPGGDWRIVMVGPDGAEYPGHGTFREIDPPRRLVTSDEFDRDHDYPGLDRADLPHAMTLTVAFTGPPDRTVATLTIRHQTAEERERHARLGVIDGWSSTLDRLERLLADLIAGEE